MSEHRCCYEIRREEQNVYGRQQDQGWATEWRNRLRDVIVYIINELLMQ